MLTQINFVELWFLYAGIVCIFIISLWISQRCNSVRLFHTNCILLSLWVLYLPFFLKWHSPWHLANVHVLVISALVSFVCSLKFLEWGFTHDWSELRTIALTKVAADCSGYPRWNTSGEKETCMKKKDIYLDNIMVLLRACVYFFVLRTAIRMVPETWMALPMSSLKVFIWPIRYLLLSFMLYLTISIVTSVVFGVGGLLWGLPVYSTFPAFPFTSYSIRELWSRRWNVFIKQLLHRTSFIIIPRWLGMSKTMNNSIRGFLSFFLSGIFHELVFTTSTGYWSGKNMIFFLLHGLFVTMEIMWDHKRKTTDSDRTYVDWLRTLGTFVITSPLFFDPWIEVGYFSMLKQYLS